MTQKHADAGPDVEPFNLLDKRNLGKTVVNELLSRPSVPLDSIERFVGAGVYVIYYRGSVPLYGLVAASESRPIYVGKAVPAGARKGSCDLSLEPGVVLYKRLAEHAESIRTANNLSLDDFTCRYLVVDDIWIPLAESLLIASFAPLWNVVVEGFGNHAPGKGRTNQRRSFWDALHPGRAWANNLQECASSSDVLTERVAEWNKESAKNDDAR